TVWDDLVGQESLVETLMAAVAAAGGGPGGPPPAGMTHAWLFTGPPGSGRSTAARAFAAALQCERGGCGECLACRTALAGSHADVRSLVTDKAQLTLEPTKEAVRLAALAPANRRWQVMIVEDADRLNDSAANALLKSIEEPPPRTVWLLCAPAVEDVLPTIRSRCRALVLRTPPTSAVAAYLVERDKVPSAVATFAARAAQGHIGRARALALDEGTRNRRREVLRIPAQLSDLGSCLVAASNVIDAATEEAKPRSDALDAKEQSDLRLAYGAGTRGVNTTGHAVAAKELQRQQRLRAKRLVRDSIDRTLLDLASYYRDVVLVQLGSSAELVNEELRLDVDTMSRSTSGEATARRLRAIFDTRELLEGEIAPLLALESLMISLRGAADE
ncbi:MAG: DNA polymerase III subunit delta', partial [Actinomycetota bacterium]|nr:DNA polymerase III subunit delta' [Actinomycetota bacterium]